MIDYRFGLADWQEVIDVVMRENGLVWIASLGPNVLAAGFNRRTAATRAFFAAIRIANNN